MVWINFWSRSLPPPPNNQLYLHFKGNNSVICMVDRWCLSRLHGSHGSLVGRALDLWKQDRFRDWKVQVGLSLSLPPSLSSISFVMYRYKIIFLCVWLDKILGFLHLYEIVEGLYFHCNLSVCLSVCLWVWLFPALLVSKIPAERMTRFGCGFR